MRPTENGPLLMHQTRPLSDSRLKLSVSMDHLLAALASLSSKHVHQRRMPECLHQQSLPCTHVHALTHTAPVHPPPAHTPTNLHTCTHAYLHTYTPAYLHACLCPYLHACMPAYLHACMPAYLHACMPACLHACMPACLHACMPACLHACWLLTAGC